MSSDKPESKKCDIPSGDTGNDSSPKPSTSHASRVTKDIRREAKNTPSRSLSEDVMKKSEFGTCHVPDDNQCSDDFDSDEVVIFHGKVYWRKPSHPKEQLTLGSEQQDDEIEKISIKLREKSLAYEALKSKMELMKEQHETEMKAKLRKQHEELNSALTPEKLDLTCLRKDKEMSSDTLNGNGTAKSSPSSQKATEELLVENKVETDVKAKALNLLRDQLIKNKDKLKKAERKNEDLGNQCGKLVLQVSSLTEAVNERKEANDQINAMARQRQDQMVALLDTKANLDEQLSIKTAMMAGLKNEIQILKRRHEEKIAEFNRKILEQSEAMEDLEKRLQLRQICVTQAEEKIKKMESELNDKNELIATLEEEVRDYQENLSEPNP